MSEKSGSSMMSLAFRMMLCTERCDMVSRLLRQVSTALKTGFVQIDSLLAKKAPHTVAF